VFTRNSYAAAPERDARARLSDSRQYRGLVVNSGVANAATGERGMELNREMMGTAADHLGLSPEDVLASSTGVIGEQLPIDLINKGIPGAVDDLAEHPGQFAEAILTTDTHAKITSTYLPELDASCLGVAKGSGMIRPDMATMLAFIFIDHPVEENVWQRTLAHACVDSFNKISVDGDMSTNDTVMGWASRLPETAPLTEDADEVDELERAVTEVCSDLAEQIVGDGEGATKRIEISVTGAPDKTVARDVANSVADSSLVKTAFHGEDPNWGRIFSSIGATAHELDPNRLTITLNDHEVFDGGPVDVVDTDLDKSMSSDRQTLRINLGMGQAHAEALTCDLSAEYVRINSEYHT